MERGDGGDTPITFHDHQEKIDAPLVPCASDEMRVLNTPGDPAAGRGRTVRKGGQEAPVNDCVVAVETEGKPPVIGAEGKATFRARFVLGNDSCDWSSCGCVRTLGATGVAAADVPAAMDDATAYDNSRACCCSRGAGGGEGVGGYRGAREARPKNRVGICDDGVEVEGLSGPGCQRSPLAVLTVLRVSVREEDAQPLLGRAVSLLVLKAQNCGGGGGGGILGSDAAWSGCDG